MALAAADVYFCTVTSLLLLLIWMATDFAVQSVLERTKLHIMASCNLVICCFCDSTHIHTNARTHAPTIRECFVIILFECVRWIDLNMYVYGAGYFD